MRSTLLMAALMPIAAVAGVIAEGKSSAAPGATIEASWRMYTIHTGPDACAKAGTPVRFEVVPDTVALHPGDSWHPAALTVRAFDADDRFVPAVPLLISVTGPAGIVDTRGAESIVRALTPGRQFVTISSYCGGSLQRTIGLRVSNRRVN